MSQESEQLDELDEKIDECMGEIEKIIKMQTIKRS